MKDIEFSQATTDAIGIITAITLCLAILILIGLLIYHYFSTEKEKNELERKKLKLEIKDLEEKSKYRETQDGLMKAKIKWHEDHRKEEE